jgi:outer membrane protein TolC
MMNKTNVVRSLMCVSVGFIVSQLAIFAQAPGAPASSGVQAPSTTAANPPAQLSIAPQAGDPTYQGSVPQGTASPTPIPLTLADAVNRGLKANLGLLTSEQSSRQTRAERYRALAGLLPNITGQLSMTEQQVNLQALGFIASIPPALGFQIPKIVGPYSYQAAQANATVPLFDYTAINNFRSSRQNVKAAVLSIKNARDLVVQAVGDAYLQIIADAARVVATQVEIEADTAVYVNATRRHEAGVAIAIDVLRSQVELKQRQQALVAETNQFEKDKLTLGRIIGLPIGQDFTVADPSPSVPLEAISLQDALAKAYDHRPDFQAAKSQVAAARSITKFVARCST